MASIFEQCNNLLLLSDPLLSLGALVVALLLACIASFFLFFIRPNTFAFLLGLALFAPDDAVLRGKVLSKAFGHRLLQYSKGMIKYFRRKQWFGLSEPPLIPGDYLHRVANEEVLPILKQHELSGFLYSKAWPVDLNKLGSEGKQTPTQSRDAPKELHWSSHWCEIWQTPGVLKVTMRTIPVGGFDQDMGGGVIRPKDSASFADKKREVVTFFDLQYLESSYLGKVIIEKKLKSESIPTPVESSAQRQMSRELSGKSLKSVSNLKTLYMFQVSLKNSTLPVRTVAGEPGVTYRTNGWVFACKGYEDALEWVRVFNAVSAQATMESFHSSAEPDVNITMKVDEATGGLVPVDSTEVQMRASRGRKLSELIKKYLHKWIRMVPDDLELMHRYFCQQQYLAEGTELGRMKSKNIQWNIASELSDFIPTVSKFNPDQRRGINALTKHSRQIIKDKNTPPFLAEASEGDLIGSFVVTVMGARNLPVKEISNSMNMGGPFGLVLPKLFVQLSVVPSSITALVYKSGGQPRSPAPVFREDFLFRDINLTRVVSGKAKLVAFVLLRTPLSLGGETYTVIGSADVSLSPFVADIFPSLITSDRSRSVSAVSTSSLVEGGNNGRTESTSSSRGLGKKELIDWYPLFDKHTGLALPDNAALQLKLKYLP